MQKLEADDLEPGKLVTVFSYRESNHFQDIFGNQDVKVSHKDNFGMGRVLEIITVDYPYVVVKIADCQQYADSFHIAIDTRDAVFAKVSKEFCKALYPKGDFDKYFKDE